MSRKTYYITTPIYYPSDRLHIGHALTTTMADTLARFNRLLGHDTWFLTGSDEHGQKIQRRAKEAGVSQILSMGLLRFQVLWRKLHIEYDDFIRTTEERHQKVVQIFSKIYDKGDIYKAEYGAGTVLPAKPSGPSGKAKEAIARTAGGPWNC